MPAGAPEYGAPNVAVNPGSPWIGHFDTNAPAGASGGGESAQGAERAIGGVSNEATALAEKMRNQADQVAINDADVKANTAETTVMNDPENGLLAKKGKDAMAAYPKAMADFQAESGKIIDGLQSEYQKTAVSHLLRARQFQIERVGQRHVSEQMSQFDDHTTQATVRASQDKAITNYSDPAIVAMELNKQKAVLTDYAARKGMEGPSADEMVTKAQSATHAGVINQLAENGSSLEAQDWINVHKDSLTPQDLKSSMALIDRTMPRDVGAEVYQAASNSKDYQTADGSIRIDKVPEIISENPAYKSLTPKQRQAAADVVATLANKDAEDLRKNNAGNAASFYSQIATADDQGVSKAEQYKAADQLAARLPNGEVDENDRAVKYNYINSAVKGQAVKDDPATVIAMHDGLLNGDVVSDAPLVKAMNDGMLSKRTATGLINLLHSEKDPAMKNQFDQIKAKAEGDFPVKEDLDTFMSNLRAQSVEQKITDPIQLQKLYKQNMETAPTGAAGFFSAITRDPNYYKSQELIHQNQELVHAMGSGDAVFKLAKQMGGPENFASGTPYSNAVLFAIQHGAKPQSLTPASIDWILKNKLKTPNVAATQQ